ncbi:hypothetical protein AURDEDRAFT_128745 [Auricularia subglabra TFB-10046 SS5]|nr:hypothetical protein AURDEDRAFT_128745 [Auricularia subglabra TFB-10046 SS5]
MSSLPAKPTAPDSDSQSRKSLLRSVLKGSIRSTAVSAAAPNVSSAPATQAAAPSEGAAPAPGSGQGLADLPEIPGLSSLKIGAALTLRDVAERDSQILANQRAVGGNLQELYKQGLRSQELFDLLCKELSKTSSSIFATLYEDFVRLDDRVVPRLIDLAEELAALRARESKLSDRIQLDFTTAINGLTNTVYPMLGSIDEAVRLTGVSINDLNYTMRDGHSAIMDAIPRQPVVSNDDVLATVEGIRRDSNETLELVFAAHSLVESLRSELTHAGIIGETQRRRSARISAAAREQSAPYAPSKLRKIRLRIPARSCKESARRDIERDELDSTDEERGTGSARIAIAAGA